MKGAAPLHDTSGWHVTHFSGNANNAGNASTFYWNLNNATSNRNRNIGSQLAVKPIARSPALGPSKGKYVNPILLGSFGEQQGEQQR
jgi:hypothetical protein